MLQSVSQIPPQSNLSRPIVPLKNLPVYDYDIKKINIVESNTGKSLNPQNFKYLTIYTIESKFWILFNDGRAEEGIPLYFQDIQDIKKNVSGTTNIISRKQDHLIEISFIGNKSMLRAGVPLIATIKVEDRLADEIHEKLRALKLLQFDRNYWERHSLSFLGAANLRKTVDIYPRTPFLADGEEMIWQSLTIETIDRESKVTKVDAITNFRVFQYDYNKHYGEGILIPNLDNNMTIDERPTLQVNSVGTYFVASYNITGIKEPGTTKIIGDITFYVNDKPSITITQITDPDTLATAVRRLKDRHNITGIDVKEQYANITSSTVRSMICSNCHHNNPPDSNFCNKCGVSLRPLTVVCDKCGHSNSSGSIFCSTCGNKLNQ